MMSTSTQKKLEALEVLLKDYPQITLATPSSPSYPKLREIFNLDQRATALAIVRPQNEGDVSLILKHCKSTETKFVVRTGGHSLFGQSQVEGALTIDMRDIKYVHVEKGASMANIGGGVLQGDLGTQLWEEGLLTPMGTIPSVGYAGWAMYGGYGPFSAEFGLGVDQITGAKVVNSKGDIVDADQERLKLIRGAGGIGGIIVELTIKVYPKTKILAGAIFFDSQNISETFKRYNAGYDGLLSKGLPPVLTTQQTVVNTPYGRLFGILFSWHSDDLELGREWAAKIEKLGGTVIMNSVAENELPDWMEANSKIVPAFVYGFSRTHSLRRISSDVAEIIGKYLEKMPSDSATMFSIHELRPSISTEADDTSVFGTREPHFMLEILGVAAKEENRAESMDWALEAWKNLGTINQENILPGTYISLDSSGLAPGEVPLSKIYGPYAREVVSLKEKYDAENVFEFAVPILKNYL